MGVTTKRLSDRDANQTLQAASIQEDDTLMVNGFLVGKVGRRVDVTVTTTTVSNDSQVFAFSESGTALYSLKLVFSDATQQTLLSAERIS